MKTINLVPQEILKICENGDIFVKGKLAENDKEIVDALRDFVKTKFSKIDTTLPLHITNEQNYILVTN